MRNTDTRTQWFSNGPNNVQGYRLMASKPTPAGFATRAGYVVMVDRETERHRYVTAWIGTGDNSWCQGHYFDDYSEALTDWEGRS